VGTLPEEIDDFFKMSWSVLCFVHFCTDISSVNTRYHALTAYEKLTHYFFFVRTLIDRNFFQCARRFPRLLLFVW